MEFPGCPVVETPCFHCGGHPVRSLVGELRSHKPRSEAKKKKLQIECLENTKYQFFTILQGNYGTMHAFRVMWQTVKS